MLALLFGFTLLFRFWAFASVLLYCIVCIEIVGLPRLVVFLLFVLELDEEWLHDEEAWADNPGDSSSACLGGHIHLKRFRQF